MRTNADRLAEVGISAAESALLNAIHYGISVRQHDLCRFAAVHGYSLADAVTLPEVNEACDQCLKKGWLQVVDKSVLVQLEADVQNSGLLGPVYGFPSLDSIEFTVEGARQWFIVCAQLGFPVGYDDSFAYEDVVHEKIAHWLSTESKARDEIEKRKAWPYTASIVGPVPVGPWRAQWWRRFDSGFRFDIESRMHWRGLVGGRDSCWFRPEDSPFDLAEAQQVLERHNVSVVEFLTLKSVETAKCQSKIGDRVKKSLEKWAPNLAAVTDDDLTQRCLERGWLQPIHEVSIAEIRAMVEADDAITPLPLNLQRYRYELDFTMAGANIYRALSAEVHGAGWENSLIVEKSYYRELHRYCATEAGLRSLQEEYSEHADVLRKARIVPIGPWCVYWWRRYAAGFRVELIIGEPTFP